MKYFLKHIIIYVNLYFLKVNIIKLFKDILIHFNFQNHLNINLFMIIVYHKYLY